MKLYNQFFIAIAASLFFVSCLYSTNKQNLHITALSTIATNAYIWGYPLVVTQRTKQQLSQEVPINSFLYRTDLATPEFSDIVTPNVDTLYASAWLDLKNYPVMLQVPAITDRYYVVQFLDAYTNSFAYVGTRATGIQAQKYIITGPSWQGKVPLGLKQIKAPTNTIWLLVRVLVKNKRDLKKAQTIVRQITVTPLAKKASKKYSKPRLGTSQEIASAGIEFFNELSHALVNNMPPKSQQKLLDQFALIGIKAGSKPSQDVTDPAIRKILTQAITQSEKSIDSKIAKLAKKQSLHAHGWMYNLKTGNYGTDYLLRAAIAKQGLGANIPEEALYPAAFKSSDGELLCGSKCYRIHFDKNQLLPVKGFWSLTIYDSITKGLVKNSAHIYAFGDRSNLIDNPDGSIDIIIQHKKPKTTKINWLPAPKGYFYLVLRFYIPKKRVLEDKYNYPAIQVQKCIN